MSAYLEQLKRVERWLSRIQKNESDQIEHQDFLYAFFQNCWHLKDWIKNDDALPPKIRCGIEDDIKRYGSLLTCADLANRSKHLVLTKPPRKDATMRGEIRVAVGDNVFTEESSSIVSWEYVVIGNDGKTISALDVARDALNEWKALLQACKLPLS
jgi:hypothetical protein